MTVPPKQDVAKFNKLARQLLALLDGHDWRELEKATAHLGLASDEFSDLLGELQRFGLALERDDELGVRLVSGVQLLDRDRIAAELTHPLRASLNRFDVDPVVDSTNSVALRWLQQGGTGRAVFLAEKQLQGRGRRGRSWVGPMARNIYLSVVWPIADLERSLEGFSLVTALSVVAGLRAAGIEGGDRLRVKWPNDVWLDGGKLAGILLELQTAGNNAPAHVVIGLGINVAMPEDSRAEIQTSVSDLASSSQVIRDRNALVAAQLNCLAANLERLERHGFEPYRQEWHSLDLYFGKPVEILDGNRRLQGVVAGVGRTGALLLDTPDGQRQVSGGELAPSVRPAAGNDEGDAG